MNPKRLAFASGPSRRIKPSSSSVVILLWTSIVMCIQIQISSCLTSIPSSSSQSSQIIPNMIPDTLPSKKLRKRYRDNERVNERFERNFNGSMRRRQKKRRGGREDDSFRFDLNRLNGMKPQQLTREIKFLSKKKRYNELRALSRSSSIPHNVYTYTALITSFALSTLVDKRRIVDDMFIEMEEKEILPNSYTITAALVAVDGGKEAMEFLDFAREKYGHCIELSELVIYNAAIKCCSRSPRRSHLNSIPMFSTSTNTNKRNPNFKENYEYALHLYANMINDGIQPNHLTFGYLLHVLGISKQAELAIELWEEMKSLNVEADARCYGAVLRACAELGIISTATTIFESIPQNMKNNLHLNSYLACLAHRSVVDIDRSFEVIKEYSYLVDIVTINTILSTCARSRAENSYNQAKSILAALHDGKYGDFLPDVISYNNILAACNLPNDCLELVNEMRLSRKSRRFDYVEASPVTYTNAIKACSIDGKTLAKRNQTQSTPIVATENYEAVKTLYDWSKVDGQCNYFVQSAFIYSMASFGATADIEELIQSWDEIGGDQLLLYNSIFKSLSVKRVTLDREHLSDRVKANKIKHYWSSLFTDEVSPSEYTYRYLKRAIDSLEKCQNETINSVLKTVEDHGAFNGAIPIPDEFLNFVVRLFLKFGEEERAYSIFKSIESPTTEHYSTILSSLSTKSKLSSKILDNIPIIHFVFLDMKTMTDIIHKLLYLRDYEKIDFYVDLMLDNLDPDNIHTTSVNRLIYALSSHNPAKALDVFRMIPQEHVNVKTYQNIMLACQRGAKHDGDALFYESALSLLRRMEEAGLKPNKQIFSSVISACCAVENWQTAFAIFQHYEESRNVYCWNSALAVCCKAGAWLEALEMYEAYKNVITPNFVTYNTLVDALISKGKQVELAANVYNEAVNKSVINHWKLEGNVELMNLHHFSTSMAQIAVYSLLNSLLTIHPRWDVADDLIIIVGKGRNNRDSSNGTSQIGSKVIDVLEGFQMRYDFVQGNTGRICVRSEVLRQYVKRIMQ